MKWFFVLFVLKWSYALAFVENITNQKEITFLFSSEGGLQFQKSNNVDGSVDIIYDCSVGLNSEGIVYLNEKSYPENIKAVVVQNCNNVTIQNSCRTQYKYTRLESLLVKNVESARLSFYNYENYHGCNCHTSLPIKEVYVNDVLRFDVEHPRDRDCSRMSVSSLKMKNVGMKNLGKWKIDELLMSNVMIGNVEEGSVVIETNKNSAVSIEDSHFQKIDSKAFYWNVSQVDILNNSFANIESKAFNVLADEFNFSDNYVNKITDSFNITSPNVKVTWNTFENEEDSWTSLMKLSGRRNEMRVLNISRNTFNVVPEQFLKMGFSSQPDLIILENNYLNCTCRNWQLFNHKLEDPTSLKYLFFQEFNQNVCVNLGNCTVNKVLNKIIDVCANRFVCTEPEPPKNTAKNYYEAILLSLKNISEILYQIADQRNYLINPQEALIVKEVTAESPEN